MHIPDGFLDFKTAATSGLCAVGGLAWALGKARRELPARKVPLLGLGAAFLFAAQMVNFPVVGGTSGHLVGGALMAGLLGVPAAVIVVSSVLIAQCFLFADGGVTALGANVFNMALVAPAMGGLGFRLVSGLIPGLRGKVAGMAFGGWCSTVAASLACAGQLAWSGTVAWSLGLPSMMGIHILIGMGEGLISALAYYAVARARPSLVSQETETPLCGFIFQSLLVCLGIALFVAPFACPWPDGLDSVARKLGFEQHAVAAGASWFSEYQIPGVRSLGLAVALAGVVGSFVAFALAWLLSRFLVRKDTARGNS